MRWGSFISKHVNIFLYLFLFFIFLFEVNHLPINILASLVKLFLNNTFFFFWMSRRHFRLMMSLHVSDISIMRKRAGCGGLGSSRYTLQWWESRRKGDRGYVCTPCIANYSLRAEGRKLWNAHRENCTGAVYICVLPWRGINSTSTLLLFGFLQNTESWTRQGRDKCVWKGDNMIRSVLRRQSVFFCFFCLFGGVFWGGGVLQCNLLKLEKAP